METLLDDFQKIRKLLYFHKACQRILISCLGRARSLSLFSRLQGNSAKILLRGLAVTKLRVETMMVYMWHDNDVLTDCYCDLSTFH